MISRSLFTQCLESQNWLWKLCQINMYFKTSTGNDNSIQLCRPFNVILVILALPRHLLKHGRYLVPYSKWWIVRHLLLKLFLIGKHLNASHEIIII